MTLRVFALLVVLHVLVAWAFLRQAGPGLPLDDAWGHLVYARSFAHGEGFDYNPGQPENGVTSPLWTILAAAPAGLADWSLVGLRPDLGMRLLGGLFGLLTTLAAFRLARRAGLWPALFVGVVFSLDPLLTFARFSGMELPLFALLTVLLIQAVLDHDVRRIGLLCGLAILTRPEGLLLAALALGILIRQRRKLSAFLVPLLVCVLPFAAWCHWVSGHPWPNTWGIKTELVTDPGSIGASLAALGGDTGYAWALLALLLVGTFALEGIVGRLALLPLLVGGLLLGGVLASRSLLVSFDPPRVPFYWERYALIAWPPLLFVAAAGLGSLVRTAWAGQRSRARASAVLSAPLVLVIVLMHGLPAHAGAVTRRYAEECADVEALNVAAGRWIDAHLPPDALVATHDAGAVRYFGKRRVLDINGNNDSRFNELLTRQQREIAVGDEPRAAYFQRAIESYLVRARPDALAVLPMLYAAGHSPELDALLRQLPPAERQQRLAQSTDVTELLGLTQRAATFEAPYGAVVGSPEHGTFAIFVRP